MMILTIVSGSLRLSGGRGGERGRAKTSNFAWASTRKHVTASIISFLGSAPTFTSQTSIRVYISYVKGLLCFYDMLAEERM
jgi:hypothetical protein